MAHFAWHSKGSSFPSNLPALTSFRFLLAFGVVLYHYQLAWPEGIVQGTAGLIERSRLGVDFFFILSGFILTHIYQDDFAKGAFHYGRFMAARFARLFPLHLLALAALLAMVSAATLMGRPFKGEEYSLSGFLQQLTLVHAWIPRDVQTMQWNAPSWSLSCEWFAYLLFPVYAWIGTRLSNRPLLLLGLAVASFIALDFAYQAFFGEIVTHAWLSLGIMRIVPEFFYGVALYAVGRRLTLSPALCWAAICLFTAGIALAMHFFADDRLIVAAAGPLLLALGLVSKGAKEGFLKRRALTFLGEASYALYVIQWPCIIAWKGAREFLLHEHALHIGIWEACALFAFMLGSTIAAHLWVEIPARRHIRNLAERIWPKGGPLKKPTPGSQAPDY